MFTGIVQHVGQVQAVSQHAGNRRVTVDLGPLAEGLATRDSMAVAGVCLTVAAVDGPSAEFDVVPATAARSTLGRCGPGRG